MGRGRPMKEIGRKSWRVDVRIGNDEQRMLIYLLSKTGESKPDIIRNALEMYYNFKKAVD